MAESRSKKTNLNLIDLLMQSWQSILQIVGAICAVLFFGYSVGVYFENEKFEREKIKLAQDCNEQVHKMETALQEEKTKRTEEKMDNLIQTVKQIVETKK